MNNIFINILPIFLIAMLGSIIRRKWLVSEEFWRNLEKLLYFFLFPLVLFNNISSSSNNNSQELIKLIVALMIATSIIVIGLIFYQRRNAINKALFTSVFQGGIRYNSYIFLSLGNALLGDKIMETVAVVAVYMIVFTNIISVMMFHLYIPSRSYDKIHLNLLSLFKGCISNPLIVASIIGFIFKYLDIHINIGVKKTIDSLSATALTIGVMNVGARLKFYVNTEHIKQILIASFVKLIIFPVVTVVVFLVANIVGDAKSVGILYSCLPPASTSYLLSKQLNGDYESMTSIITFSTIFSVFTLSFLMYILA